MKYFRFKPEVIVIVFVEMRIEIGSLDSLDSPDALDSLSLSLPPPPPLSLLLSLSLALSLSLNEA